jgi:hypothetical protein
MLLMGCVFSLGAIACSDPCEDAQEACEDCGEGDVCAAQVDTCETYPEDGAPSRDSCCEALLESFEPCP